MIALFGSLLGFLGSLAPEILKLFTDKRDKAHEVVLLQMQIEREKAGLTYKLEAIEAKADSDIQQAVYKTYTTGIHWVDALNGTVRPIIAYAFFVLYAAIKIMAYVALPEHAPLFIIYGTLWTEEDTGIFAGIVSFYFGSRSFKKK